MLRAAGVRYCPTRNGLETVQALLAQGADVNAKDNLGYTALMYAAENGHTETAQALLARRADVNAKENKSGLTTLMAALANGRTETAQALLAHGTDVNAKDNFGWTALMYAKEMGYVETIRMLKKAGAK